jgi:hypothetical protein
VKTVASGEVTQLVRVPKERAFEGYLEAYKTVPRLFPELVRSMVLLRQEGNERVFRCEEVWSGRRFNYTMRETLQRPDRVDQAITEGEGKGIRSTFTFTAANVGTQIRMAWEWRGLKGAILGGLMKKEFQREFQQVVARWARAIEARA